MKSKGFSRCGNYRPDRVGEVFFGFQDAARREAAVQLMSPSCRRGRSGKFFFFFFSPGVDGSKQIGQRKDWENEAGLFLVLLVVMKPFSGSMCCKKSRSPCYKRRMNNNLTNLTNQNPTPKKPPRSAYGLREVWRGGGEGGCEEGPRATSGEMSMDGKGGTVGGCRLGLGFGDFLEFSLGLVGDFACVGYIIIF